MIKKMYNKNKKNKEKDKHIKTKALKLNTKLRSE